MSDLSISVSIEGLELAAWEDGFRAELAKASSDLGLKVAAVVGAGAIGARRSGAVRVRSDAASTDPLDLSLKILGVVLSALSLAVGAAQLGIKSHGGDGPSHPPTPTFACTIQGPQGTKQLIVTAAAIPSEHVLRECLKATGVPTKITAAPKRSP